MMFADIWLSWLLLSKSGEDAGHWRAAEPEGKVYSIPCQSKAEIKFQSCPQDLLNMKNLQKYVLTPASSSKLFVAAKLYMILNPPDLISADKSGDPF
jgi:hypothetical protein